MEIQCLLVQTLVVLTFLQPNFVDSWTVQECLQKTSNMNDVYGECTVDMLESTFCQTACSVPECGYQNGTCIGKACQKPSDCTNYAQECLKTGEGKDVYNCVNDPRTYSSCVKNCSVDSDCSSAKLDCADYQCDTRAGECYDHELCDSLCKIFVGSHYECENNDCVLRDDLWHAYLVLWIILVCVCCIGPCCCAFAWFFFISQHQNRQRAAEPAPVAYPMQPTNMQPTYANAYPDQGQQIPPQYGQVPYPQATQPPPAGQVDAAPPPYPGSN
eukprot:m.38749 g.38749  ORF g.38749 m.38749 type:complete len:272 (-) comp9471_c1_seq1:2659-3474(-)